MTRQVTALKQAAGERAVDFVESGMVIGLGTGSTAVFATRRLGALLAGGVLRDIVGIPTSAATAREARAAGIPLRTDDWECAIDVTIDGADEVDPTLQLIKGGGGALLREKIVAQVSERTVIVVDDSKLSPRLGTRSALPVEVVPFGWPSQLGFLEALGAHATLRVDSGGVPTTTDLGHYLIDCVFGPIADPVALAGRLASRAGVVEHGLFLDLATDLVVASDSGVIHRSRSPLPHTGARADVEPRPDR